MSPSILIGLNNAHLLTTTMQRGGGIGEPMAAKTRLGWAIYGENNVVGSVNFHVMTCSCSNEQNLDEMMKQYFKVKQIRIGTEVLESAENKQAREILERTTVQVEGRYETGLLWRSDTYSFPDSFGMALRRLHCLERRLSKNEAMYANVRRQVVEYVQKGYAHELTETEKNLTPPHKVWYLPLRVLQNP